METVLWLPFNFDDRARGDKPGFRYAATLARPEWWVRRAAILRDYVVPCLKRALGLRTFRVWGVFQPCDWEKAQPVRDVLTAAGFEAVVDSRLAKERGPTELRLEPCVQLLAEFAKLDRLLLVRCDSDDLWLPSGLSALIHLAECSSPGSAFFVEDGYLYDTRTKRLLRWLAKGAPPAFQGVLYDSTALVNREAWYRWRRRFGVECYHHELPTSAQLATSLGNGLYCILAHGDNTTDDWNNQAFLRHVGHGITDDEERALVLRRFGLPA